VVRTAQILSFFAVIVLFQVQVQQKSYACGYHAEALQKLASAMKLHIAVENYILDDKPCTNCLNERSIAKGDLDE